MTLPEVSYCANIPPLQAVTAIKANKWGVFAQSVAIWQQFH